MSATVVGRVGVDDLSDLDRRMLAFERRWWQLSGSKEQAIRVAFALTSVGYYRRLNRLVESPAALAADPVTVNRLRRGRDGLVARRLRGTG